LAIVKALKERGLIDIGAVPTGKGGVKFMDFLTDFWDYEKSVYVKDRLSHGHSIGRNYCGINGWYILNYWLSDFKGRTLASITRSELKAFSLSLPAGKSASCKNSILNAGLIPLGWAYEEGMIPADIAKPWADGAAIAAMARRPGI
jgi:hypothetical protein